VKKNIHNREQLSELFSKLEIHDQAVMKSVESELLQYFDKDGKFV
jgi:hypothetical protein